MSEQNLQRYYPETRLFDELEERHIPLIPQPLGWSGWVEEERDDPMYPSMVYNIAYLPDQTYRVTKRYKGLGGFVSTDQRWDGKLIPYVPSGSFYQDGGANLSQEPSE